MKIFLKNKKKNILVLSYEESIISFNQSHGKKIKPGLTSFPRSSSRADGHLDVLRATNLIGTPNPFQ